MYKESAFLAERIYEIENDKNLAKDFLIQDSCSYSLDKDTSMSCSYDCLVWYIWKDFPDQARGFFKVVPKVNYPKEKIEEILDAQAWVCV